jgi:hypothetical protein
MILYRVVKVITRPNQSLKIGATMELDRHSSFRILLRWRNGTRRLAERTMYWFSASRCARVRHSCSSVGGIGRGLSTNPSSASVEDIDNTQGEIVLAPTLKKTDKNVRTTICDGFSAGRRTRPERSSSHLCVRNDIYLIDEV